MSDLYVSTALSIDIVASIIDASPVGMMVFDASGCVVFANQQAETIFCADDQVSVDSKPDEESSKSTLVGKRIKDLIPQRFRNYHNDVEKEYMQHPIPKAMGVGRHLVGLRGDGSEVPLDVGLSPLNYNNEQYILASLVDISDRLRVAQLEIENRRLEKEATHDPLTGLPNRRMLTEFAEKLRSLAVRNNQRLTIMFLDLDGFKMVNDQYGHHVGDQLLCEVASVLKRLVRESDIVGRYGGDEFLLCFVGDDKVTIEGEGRCGKKMARHLARGIESIRVIDGHDISIGASIGVVSTARPAAVTIDGMINAADRLMYKAKKAGIKKTGISRVVMGELHLPAVRRIEAE